MAFIFLFGDLLNWADWIMAAPRRVIELGFTEEDVVELTRLARLRTATRAGKGGWWRCSNSRASANETPRRRQAGLQRARKHVEIPINRSIGHNQTNALSINVDQRGAPPAYAAIASAIVIGANHACGAPVRR
jgi:hypothetical protein